MKIILNGAPREVHAADLDTVLEELGFADARVATALNEEFVPATARAGCALNEGDRLEVVAPMQGG